MGIRESLASRNLPRDVVSGLKFWCQPLADALIQDAQKFSRTMLVAMAGPPHSSKSIFAEFLKESLIEMGCPTAHIRVSDFRMSRHARERIAEVTHPLLMYPGQIGTHDTRELERVLMTLRTERLVQPLHVPVFDKAMDVRTAFSKWLVIRDAPRIVLVSGWSLGVQAKEGAALLTPVNALEEEQDPNGVWREYVNKAIQDDYQPLYALFDRWVFRKAPSYEAVRNWIADDHAVWLNTMQEAGIELSQSQRTVGGMYADLCERPSMESMERLAAKSDYLITLNENRKITSFARQRND